MPFLRPLKKITMTMVSNKKKGYSSTSLDRLNRPLFAQYAELSEVRKTGMLAKAYEERL
jgi:hypothetical protein